MSAKSVFVNILVYPLVVNGETSAVIVIEDVTGQYRMKEELAHIRKLDVIGQLAGGVAHDFNNMFGGILGGAELLSRRVDPGSREKEYLDMIVKSTKGEIQPGFRFSLFSDCIRDRVDSCHR